MDRGITGAMWTAFEQSTDRIVAAEESSLILILKKEIEKLRGRLKAYEDTGLTPEEVSALVKDWSDLRTIVGECGGLDRVRALAKADRDGRLVVLPCKAGDTVYRIVRDADLHIARDEVRNMYFADDMTLCVELVGGRIILSEKFGKTVFMTREEAEKALEAMKNE